jgi:hypothetical protein
MHHHLARWREFFEENSFLLLIETRLMLIQGLIISDEVDVEMN